MPGQRHTTEYMPLSKIVRAFRNPRAHHTEMIANMITRFGFVEHPTIDERTGRLVAGHGRLDDLQARRDAGEDPPHGIDVDDSGEWLIPVNRGWASNSDAEAEAYLVGSNAATVAGHWGNESLAMLLADIRDQDPSLVALVGYDDAFIAKHWEGDTNPWAHAVDEGGSDDDPPPPGKDNRCPECGHEWDGPRRPALTGDQ